MLTQDAWSLLSNRVLELTVFPTERCNLRCAYCYEDHQLGRMSDDSVVAVKRLIAGRASKGLDHLSLGWFGGEPLLQADLVEDLSSFSLQLSRKHGFCLSSGMSTNGLLLSRTMVTRMTQCGVKTFQVSLDGPKEYHDEVRVAANGEGTFDRIWGNLLEMRDGRHEFKINLRVHFSKLNITVLPNLIRMIEDNFGGDSRFRVHFKAIAPLGEVAERELGCYSESDAAKIKKQLGERLSSAVAEVLPTGSGYICYAARPTAFVIRADGRLCKCTVALDEPENHIGWLRNDGRLEILQERARAWLAGMVEGDTKKMRCPWAFLQADSDM